MDKLTDAQLDTLNNLIFEYDFKGVNCLGNAFIISHDDEYYYITPDGKLIASGV